MTAFFAAVLFSLLLSPIIAVHWSSSTYNCRSYTVPLQNISAPSFNLTFEMKTQWNIMDWTINEARCDSVTAFNGIAGPSTGVGDFDITSIPPASRLPGTHTSQNTLGLLQVERERRDDRQKRGGMMCGTRRDNGQDTVGQRAGKAEQRAVKAG
ncbi:hypothetical protein DFH08DRAFT_811379 [Mycena albidolilacea]|uniref:Uncharacterized protein n=1 Tax=Mycena albidolilacea TaxID=1033008 RepID=A0AAD6ZWK0_9AGAR|nr:hypothetical protein DFH08DRAFT_811379 [Mycena albidolilacea]